jgi:HEAT repeat protein
MDIPLQVLIAALQDYDTSLNPRFLYRLSDLENKDLELLKPVWRELPLERRQALMEDIEELSASDYLLDFVALSRFALRDDDDKVRLLAVRTLWEYEDNTLIPVFLDLIENDDDTEVRAAAAGALGRYVYAGEIEEISELKLRQVEDALLRVMQNNEDARIQRSALESLGFSSRAEVQPLIEAAFKSEDKQVKASALFAMGRSANREWKPQVMSMLESNIPLLRSEAARASGELELADSLPYLLEMLDDPNDSARKASIWSLSQIGGEGAREALEGLYEEAEDEEEIDFLETALENLTFTEGVVKFPPLIEFPEDFEEDQDDEEEWYAGLEEIDDLLDDEADLVD